MNRREPLHRVLSSELRRRIESGVLAAGDLIPSEAELSREFGASRGPVRQALATLRAEGVIVGGQGRSPVVRRATPSQPFSTFVSFSEWAETMGKRPGQSTLELTRRPASDSVADVLQVTSGSVVVEVLRLRLLDGLPTMIERSSFVEDVGRRLFEFDTDSGSIYRYLLSAGVALDRATHTIDAVAADEHDAEILDIRSGAPLLRERRVASTSDGRPVEFADDRYRPELANFVIDNALERRVGLARSLPSAEREW